MARNRNKNRLVYWSSTETLALMGTGITREQIYPSQKRRFAASPRKVEGMLKLHRTQSKERTRLLLESEPSITAGADNFQEITLSKFQDVGKTSVAMEGTVVYEMRNRQRVPKAGSIIQQHDIDKTEYEVMSVDEVDGDVYRLVVHVRRRGGSAIVLRHEDTKTIVLPSLEFTVKDLADIGELGPIQYLDRIPLPSSGLPSFHMLTDKDSIFSQDFAPTNDASLPTKSTFEDSSRYSCLLKLSKDIHGLKRFLSATMLPTYLGNRAVEDGTSEKKLVFQQCQIQQKKK